MTTTTFKGARYIVKFADPIEWDATRAYEAIESVQYNGFTYISKQPVPVGVQIDNEAFWLLWADPNAQMEQLRQLVEDCAEQVGTLSGTVDDLSDDIDTIATIIPASDFSAANTVKKYIDFDISKAHVFDTVAAMKVDDTLAVGTICHTNGFHTVGDNGAAWYEIKDTGTADEMSIIACGELFAHLIIEDEMCPIQFGAYGNGVNDDSACIDACFDAISVVDLKSKRYVVDNTNHTLKSNTEVKNGTFILSGGYTAHRQGCIYAEAKENLKLYKVNIEGTGALSSGAVHGAGVWFYNCENIEVIGCSFTDMNTTYAVVLENCENGNVSNNYIKEYSYSGIALLNGSFNMHVNYNSIIDCVNNTSANTYPLAIAVADSDYVKASDTVECIGNYIDNQFPWWEGIDAHGVSNAIISKNTVKNCYVGIAIVANSNDSDYISKDIIISDNVVMGSETGDNKSVNNMGIVANKVTNVNITGNVIQDYGKLTTASIIVGGVWLALCKNAIVNANNISDIKGIGVYVTGDPSDNIVISNNKIYEDLDYTNTYPAFRIAAYAKDLFIIENILSDFSRLAQGIQNPVITQMGYCRIADNISDNYSIAYPAMFSNQALPGAPSSYSVLGGMIGDICMNYNPSSGNPIGWICTQSQDTVNETGAVYTALANI